MNRPWIYRGAVLLMSFLCFWGFGVYGQHAIHQEQRAFQGGHLKLAPPGGIEGHWVLYKIPVGSWKNWRSPESVAQVALDGWGWSRQVEVLTFAEGRLLVQERLMAPKSVAAHQLAAEHGAQLHRWMAEAVELLQVAPVPGYDATGLRLSRAQNWNAKMSRMQDVESKRDLIDLAPMRQDHSNALAREALLWDQICNRAAHMTGRYAIDGGTLSPEQVVFLDTLAPVRSLSRFLMIGALFGLGVLFLGWNLPGVLRRFREMQQ